MNIRDLFPSPDQWSRLREVEARLLTRKATGKSAGWVALGTAVIQAVLILADKDYLKKLIQFDFKSLYTSASPWFIFLCIVSILSFILYLVLRRTSLLIKEAKEPFHYTFFIEAFRPVEPELEKQFKGSERLGRLLHHDLTERLNGRIQRFSLLEEPKEKEGGEKNLLSGARLSSHIHIGGHYAIREEKKNEWVLHIMPVIRIGSIGAPATLATSIKYPISKNRIKAAFAKDEAAASSNTLSACQVLNADEYNHVVERVYSCVATEIYKQIDTDVRKKIELFPTVHLQSMALFYEAEDFAASNTIDAYERAIALYKDAMQKFNRWNLYSYRKNKLFLPWIGKKVLIENQFKWARLVIGYSKCRFYTNQMSSMSGRRNTTFYELPELLEKVSSTLEKLHMKICCIKNLSYAQFLAGALEIPKKGERKRKYGFDATLVREQKQLLFETYIVSALVYTGLESIKKAEDKIRWAEVTAPDELKNPLYLLVKGLTEPVLSKAILRLQEAVEQEPNAQILRWYLGRSCEKEFRWRNEITYDRACTVLQEYEEVLKINAGNIAALGAQGFLLWLLQQPEAERRLEDGRQIKAIARETFTGELNFRLARIAAEKGNYNECRSRYMEAISADASIGACYNDASAAHPIRSDYLDMNLNMLRRFEGYKNEVEKAIADLMQKKGKEKNNATYWHLFSIDLQYRQELEQLVLTEQLHQHFQSHGFGLSPNAGIQELKAGRRWLIEDPGTRSYYIEAANEGLDIFYECSRKTLEAAYSFVLNDYGNACLRYFHYHGDRECLYNAIHSFEQARKYNPEDAAPLFNLQNAYSWANQYDKIMECFDTAKQLAPTWSILAINLEKELYLNKHLQTQEELKKLENDVVQASGKVADKKRELEKVISGVKVERVSRRETVPVAEIKEAGFYSDSFSSGIYQPDVKIKQLREEIKEGEKNVNSLNRKVQEEKKQLQSQLKSSLENSLIKIWRISRLEYLYQSINEITDYVLRLPYKCLDETDVEVLISSCELLCRSDETEHLNAAEKIAGYLQALLPENIRLVSVLRDICKARFEKEEAKSLQWNHAKELNNEKISDYLIKDLGHQEMIIDSTAKVEKIECGWRIVHGGYSFAIVFINGYFFAFREHKKESYKVLIQNLNEIKKSWDEIVQLWLKSEPEAFTILYWYMRDKSIDQAKSSVYLSVLDDIRKAKFLLHPYRFDHLLGNVYFSLEMYEEAAEAYDKAIQGLTKVNNSNYGEQSNEAGLYFSMGEVLIKLNKFGEAVDAYNRATQLNPDKTEYQTKLAAAMNYHGNTYFANSDYVNAARQYTEAIRFDGTQDVYYSNLSLALEKMPSDNAKDNLEAAIAALQLAIELNRQSDYQERLKKLQLNLQVFECYGRPSTLELSPASDPIILEMADDLVDCIAENEQLKPEVLKWIELMRSKLLDEYGVRVPGVRLRSSVNNLEHGTYIISINEVPVISKKVNIACKFVLNHTADPQIKDLEIEKGVDPLTGQDGFWIAMHNWEKLDALEGDSFDAVEYMLRHLQQVAQTHFVAFFGIQEVWNKCEESELEAVREINKSPHKLSAFTDLLQALLAEGVSIASFDELGMAFLENEEKEKPEALLERLRLLAWASERRKNHFASYEQEPVEEELIEKITSSLVDAGPMKVLAYDPETCQDVLSLLRQKVNGKRKPVLVTNHPSTRIFLKKLVEVEFPLVPVLSTLELQLNSTFDEAPVE